MERTYKINEIKQILQPIFSELPVQRATLFGSYAKGTAHKKSDVDLLVDSQLRGFQFISMCEDVREALGLDVDIFDVTHIDKKSAIDMEIGRTGIVIHEK